MNSRDRSLQHRRPAPQWMSGQEKDMAGMGDNWSWRKVPINMGWVSEPLSGLIHAFLTPRQRMSVRRQLGVIGVEVEGHSIATDA